MLSDIFRFENNISLKICNTMPEFKFIVILCVVRFVLVNLSEDVAVPLTRSFVLHYCRIHALTNSCTTGTVLYNFELCTRTTYDNKYVK